MTKPAPCTCKRVTPRRKSKTRLRILNSATVVTAVSSNA
jgi:hypothetical protein